jgi:hypothetical protein
MRRREFIAGLGSAATWPCVAGAQQSTMPVVGFVNAGAKEASSGYVAAFRKGLGEIGYVEGQNVRVEYHWLEGQFDRLPELMADLVHRRVAVIATPGTMNGYHGDGRQAAGDQRVGVRTRLPCRWPATTAFKRYLPLCRWTHRR